MIILIKIMTITTIKKKIYLEMFLTLTSESVPYLWDTHCERGGTILNSRKLFWFCFTKSFNINDRLGKVEKE